MIDVWQVFSLQRKVSGLVVPVLALSGDGVNLLLEEEDILASEMLWNDRYMKKR